MNRFKKGDKVVCTTKIYTHFNGHDLLEVDEGAKGDVLVDLGAGSYDVKFGDTVTVAFDEELSFVQ